VSQVLGGGLFVDAILGGEIFEGVSVAFGEQIQTVTQFVEEIGSMF